MIEPITHSKRDAMLTKLSARRRLNAHFGMPNKEATRNLVLKMLQSWPRCQVFKLLNPLKMVLLALAIIETLERPILLGMGSFN